MNEYMYRGHILKLKKLEQLIVSSDLQELYISDLKEVSHKMGVKSNESSVYMINKLSPFISHRNHKIMMILSKYMDKIFIDGSVSWFKCDRKYLLELVNIILSSNVKMKYSSSNKYSLLLGISNFNKYINNSYILRYECKLGSRTMYDSNGHFKLMPRIYYASVIVIPNDNLIEFRANRMAISLIVNNILKYYNDKSFHYSLSHVYIGNRGDFRKKIKLFRDRTGAILNESVDIPNRQELHLSNSNMNAIINIVKVINNRLDNESNNNVNLAVDNLHLPKVDLEISFPLLLLTGLKKT